MRSVPKVLLGVVIAIVGISSVGLAQTPDGETPAEEDVCTAAGLEGAAWGLCNSYCEAKDCDSDSPKASATACSRVRDNFQRATDGQELPCENRCPCSFPIPFSSWGQSWGRVVEVRCYEFRTWGHDVGGGQALVVNAYPSQGFGTCAAQDNLTGTFEYRRMNPGQFTACSEDILAYLEALRDDRDDLTFTVFGAPDLDSCQPVSAPE